MADSYVEALEDCTLCMMSRDDVTRVIGRYPAIPVRMLDRMASRLREAEDRLADVAYRPVHARVANTLLRLGRDGRELHATACEEGTSITASGSRVEVQAQQVAS